MSRMFRAGMPRRIKSLVAAAAVIYLASLQAVQAYESDPFQALPRLSDQALDEMRGGFEANGLKISVGLDVAVLVNGVVQVTNLIDIPDLSDLATHGNSSTGEGAVLPNEPTVIQIGDGNFISPDALTSTAGLVQTIVQNTLDNQVIGSIAVWNIDISNIGAVPSLRLDAFLPSQLLDLLSP